MLQVLAGALFGLAPLMAILVPQAPVVSAAALYDRQLQWPDLPSNLTEDVLQVAFAISPPCANNTYCMQLTTTVVPRCERLRGDPGCWCGNHDPLHYCAICMSNPTNNETTADQTQAATAGHNAFHLACTAYEQLINGTATVSTSSSSVAGSSTAAPSATAAASTDGGSKQKVPIGPIIGGAVGGVVGLALVFGLVYLISLMIKRNNNTHNHVTPSSVSYMSSEPMSYGKVAAPYPTPSIVNYSNQGHVSPTPHGYNHSPEPMNPNVNPLGYPQPPQS